MKTKEKHEEKSFEAVKYMREQRDRISIDIMDLSPDEVVAYFENQKKTKLKTWNNLNSIAGLKPNF